MGRLIRILVTAALVVAGVVSTWWLITVINK